MKKKSGVQVDIFIFRFVQRSVGDIIKSTTILKFIAAKYVIGARSVCKWHAVKITRCNLVVAVVKLAFHHTAVKAEFWGGRLCVNSCSKMLYA